MGVGLKDMSNKKLLFIAHTYHEKTKSCDFLVDFLSGYFEVNLVYGLPGRDVYNQYNEIVFWQITPEKNVLKKLKDKNIIFFPMYDGIRSWKKKDWNLFKSAKVINFSKTVDDMLKKWNFSTLYLQYFIEPKGFYKGNEKEIFFWQRVEPINFSVIKKIFTDDGYKIHLHTPSDPNNKFEPPSEEDINQYSMSFSNWFDSKQEMWDLIKSKQLYVAPRVAEGIGMSFLEAMSMGKVIVANNEPTMNEYIVHGKNGYLFDLENPKSIDFSNIEQVQKNTWEFCNNGYKKWVEDRVKIVDFINEEKPKKKFLGFISRFAKNLF